MKIALLVILLLLPLASAENFTLIDGFVDTMGEPFGADNASQELFGGGGSPTEPAIDWVNSNLKTKWGFVIVMAAVAILMMAVGVVLIGSIIPAFIVYIYGGTINLQPLSLYAWGTFILSAILLWFITRRSKKLKGMRNLAIALFVLLLIAVIVLTALGYAGFVIPGWSY